ncbi:MAG: hypothetical protein HYY46_15210 [Deltaproteobacteria bacterium]|nr:hypothetical protein [Deltaproteobacteria bacterium]
MSGRSERLQIREARATDNVAAGSGGMSEFTASGPGTFLLVDHNQLSQVANGLMIPFVAR